MTTSTARALILVLALVGLGAAGTSSYVHYRLLTEPGFTSFCDVNATVSCTQAYLSDYGSVAGVPVALAGVLYFLVVLLIAGLAWRPAPVSRTAAPAPAPGYIFAFSLPALAIVAYLAYAAFFVLNAFCILCITTYVAVIAITWLSWSVAQRPLTALPAHASRDAARVLTTPIGAVIVLALVVGSVVAVKAFPSEARMTAPVAVEALPPVTDAQRAQLAQWWEMQPKVDVPVDGGGAKVVVVKFNDYQCPSCRVTHYSYKALLQQHGSAVKYVLKHYPLEGECNASSPGGGHTASCEAAAAVNMARAKGTADAMEEWLFANIGPPALTPAQVKKAARDVGGITDFDAQYPQVLKGIREEAALGDRLKVNSTPTFFINGRLVPQILAAQYFNALIEIELKRP